MLPNNSAERMLLAFGNGRVVRMKRGPIRHVRRLGGELSA
jgi:hypothetical protein